MDDRGEMRAFLGILGSVALVSCAAAGCGKEESTANAAPVHGGGPLDAVPPAPPQEKPPEPEIDPFEQMLAIPTLQEALAVALPAMQDGQDEVPDGTIQFATWAAAKMRLVDVAVTKNETSAKRVKKDSDSERGKRLCVSGKIIQIAKQNTRTEPIFIGLLSQGYSEMFHFFAARSTGDIVEDSRAKLCGVVTGRYSYSNAGGGTTHSVQIVGVFDIAENR